VVAVEKKSSRCVEIDVAAADGGDDDRDRCQPQDGKPALV
jgi:hypothetical protein